MSKYLDASIPIFGLKVSIFCDVNNSPFEIFFVENIDLLNFLLVRSVFLNLLLTDRNTCSEISLKFFNCDGVIEKLESCDFEFEFNLKCFSIATTPNGIDTKDEVISFVWSDNCIYKFCWIIRYTMHYYNFLMKFSYFFDSSIYFIFCSHSS